MAGTSTPDGVDLQEHFAQLDIACACFIDQPAPEALDSATAVAQTVADAVSGCGLVVTSSELFGSVPCGLALSSDSDIDVCLTLQRPHPSDCATASKQQGVSGARALERLTLSRAAIGLTSSGFEVDVILGAKVPVLKCLTPSGLHVDVVIGHREVTVPCAMLPAS